MKTNQEYKNAALAALKGNWAPAVVATIIYMIIAIAVYMLTGIYDETTMTVNAALVLAGASVLISIFFSYPLSVGYYNASKELALKGDNNCTANLFKSGFGKYFRNVWGMFLMGLFMFLWTLLFIIPGIVASYSYAMTPYIMAEHPEMTASEAIRASKTMMKDNKWALFCLDFSFWGWSFLCGLTLNIGYIFLNPYKNAAHAAFYRRVSVSDPFNEEFE